MSENKRRIRQLNRILRRANLILQPVVIVIALFALWKYRPPNPITLALPWILVVMYAVMIFLDALEPEVSD